MKKVNKKLKVIEEKEAKLECEKLKLEREKRSNPVLDLGTDDEQQDLENYGKLESDWKNKTFDAKLPNYSPISIHGDALGNL